MTAERKITIRTYIGDITATLTTFKRISTMFWESSVANAEKFPEVSKLDKETSWMISDTLSVIEKGEITDDLE